DLRGDALDGENARGRRELESVEAAARDEAISCERSGELRAGELDACAIHRQIDGRHVRVERELAEKTGETAELENVWDTEAPFEVRDGGRFGVESGNHPRQPEVNAVE